MTKSVMQLIQNNLRKILFGTLVSGVLLFQGTGFITSPVYGANANQTIETDTLVTETLVDTADQNTGLWFGASSDTPYAGATSVPIRIADGAIGVIGHLDESASTIDVDKAVTLTMNTGSSTVNTIAVGTDSADTVSTLYIAGSGTKTASTVTMTDGTILYVSDAGVLYVGADEGTNAVNARGVLNINNGAQLMNNNAFAAEGDTAGVVVSTYGEIVFGAENEALTENILAGNGFLYNKGTITVLNTNVANTTSHALSIYTYSDTSSAVIDAENAAVEILRGPTATDSSIAIAGKITSDSLTFGNNLTVNSTATVVTNDLVLASETTTKQLTSVVNAGSITVKDSLTWTPLDDAEATDPITLTFTNNNKFVFGTNDTDDTDDTMTIGTNMTFNNALATSATNTPTVTIYENLEISGVTAAATETALATTGGVVSASASTVMTVAGTTTIKENGALNISGTSTTAMGSVALTTLNLQASGDLTTSNLNISNSQGTFAVTEANISSGAMSTGGGTTTLTTVNMTGGYLQNTATSSSLSGTTTITTLNMDAGTGDTSGTVYANGGTTTISELNMTAGTIAASSTTISGTAYQGTLKIQGGDLAGGTIKTTGGLTSFSGGTLNGTIVDTTSGTTSFAGGSVTKAGVLATSDDGDQYSINVSNGTTAFTSYTADVTAADDGSLTFASITGDGIVNIATPTGSSPSLTVRKGEIVLNANYVSQADDEDSDNVVNFAADNGGSIALTFTKDVDNIPVLLNVTSGTVNLAEGSIIDVNDLVELDAGTYYSDLTAIASGSVEGTNYDITDNSSFRYGDSLFYDFTKEVETDVRNRYKLEVKGFDSFAATGNQHSAASYIDTIRTSGTASDELKQELLRFTTNTNATEADVRQMLDQVGGVQHANALMLAMDDPWRHPFNQMNFSSHRNRIGQSANLYDTTYLGQMVPCGDECGENGYSLVDSVFGNRVDTAPHDAWATFHHTTFTADNDGNSADYGISRTGVNIGYDIVNSMDVVAGLMFGYSQPFLYSGDNRINTTSFKLGLYGGRTFTNGMELKLYLGIGTQDYESRRDVRYLGYSDRYHMSYSGQNVGFCVQLSRDIMIDCNAILRPLIQFDLQQAWQESATETGGAMALHYDDADWNRSFVRAGFEGEVNAQFLQITSRALYAYKVGGDNAPVSRSQFVNASSPNTWMNIEGVDLQSSYVDLGIGALGYLDCSRNWTITGNYDFVASKESRAHSGSVSLMYLF